MQYENRRVLNVCGETGFTGEVWIEKNQSASSGVTGDERGTTARRVEVESVVVDWRLETQES
jgi:hypothetical protein